MKTNEGADREGEVLRRLYSLLNCSTAKTLPEGYEFAL
jgi:hypothetical protein